MLDNSYFESMPKFADMTYWFYLKPGNTVVIFRCDDNEEIAHVTEVDGQLKLSDHDVISMGPEVSVQILSDWEKYKNRPEYVVGRGIKYTTPEGAQVTYEMLLYGCLLIKTYDKIHGDPDIAIPRVRKCIDWLRSTDFFDCPASTQYHDSEPHGLLYHTLQVVDRIVCLLAAQPFMSLVSYESAILVALVHDWCKIGLYESYSKNVKDPITGAWKAVPSYKYLDTRAVAFGHGASSMYLALKFFNLTLDEAYAIRWHMGEYNVANNEMNELHQANRIYPLCYLIQFADRLACTDY